MLHLTTGLPGHGKTLFTIDHVEKLRQQSGRPVWYKRKATAEDWGIENLTLPWTPIDEARDWWQCPPGSIIVIDECQNLFPSRRQGAEVPVWCEKVSTHRHQGFDLFLITQDAMQFDAFVRRLVGRHWHLKRSFGMERSRVYEWQGVGNPGDYHSKKDALKTWFSFPTEVFKVYHSAEVHTVKKTVPWKPFVIAGGGTALVVGMIWFGVHTLATSGLDEPQPGDAAAAPSVWDGQVVSGFSSSSRQVPVNWSEDAWKPRVAGISESAPVFDQVVTVEEGPRIAGCLEVRIGNRIDCRCTTQQGTVVPDLDIQACRSYMKTGVFNWRGQDVPYYPAIPAYVPPLPGAADQVESGWEAQAEQDSGGARPAQAGR